MTNDSDFQGSPREFKQMPMVSEAHMAITPGKKPLTFGDFVAGVYRTWGERRATGVVQLALRANMIEFRGTERFVIS